MGRLTYSVPMTVTMSPYLSFAGEAGQAFAFYQSVFGGTLDLTTFGEFGVPDAPAEQIMHVTLQHEAFSLMGSDVPPSMGFEAGQRIRSCCTATTRTRCAAGGTA